MERRRRQLSQGHLTMAVLALIWQIVQTVGHLARGEVASGLLGALGLSASLVAAALLSRKTLPEHRFRRLVVPAASGWLLAQLAIDLVTAQRVAFPTYFNYLIVLTLAFAVWPLRQAGALAGVVSALLLLAALLGRGSDLLVLNAVFFTAALTAYMSAYNTPLREANDRAQKAEAMIRRDGITGLLQREAALAQLQNLYVDPSPEATPLAVILLRLEGLGQINQEHGYGSGDRTLQTVASVLRRQCGPQDSAARWSGTTFLLTMQNANRREAQGRLE